MRKDIKHNDLTYSHSYSRRGGNSQGGHILYKNRTIGHASRDAGMHGWKFIPDEERRTEWKAVSAPSGGGIKALLETIEAEGKTTTWNKLAPSGDDIESTLAGNDGVAIGFVNAYRYTRGRRTYDGHCGKCQQKFMEIGELADAQEFLEHHISTCPGADFIDGKWIHRATGKAA